MEKLSSVSPCCGYESQPLSAPAPDQSAETPVSSSSSSSITPLPKYCILSGSMMKLIAVITMTIDHIGYYIMRYYDQCFVSFFKIGSYDFTAYYLSRTIGRIAFPIFCFLITEGFLHTRNRLRYGFRLLLFALASEIPFHLAANAKLYGNDSHNVFFTLFLGYLGLCAVEYFRRKKSLQIVSVVLLFLIAGHANCDYMHQGFCFILLMYYLRSCRIVQAVAGSALLPNPLGVLLAFIPINLYNGKRGFIQHPVLQYLFYLFYPVHLLIIYYFAHYSLHLI